MGVAGPAGPVGRFAICYHLFAKHASRAINEYYGAFCRMQDWNAPGSTRSVLSSFSTQTVRYIFRTWNRLGCGSAAARKFFNPLNQTLPLNLALSLNLTLSLNLALPLNLAALRPWTAALDKRVKKSAFLRPLNSDFSP